MGGLISPRAAREQTSAFISTLWRSTLSLAFFRVYGFFLTVYDTVSGVVCSSNRGGGRFAHEPTAIELVPCLRLGSPFGVTQHVLVSQGVVCAWGSLRVSLVAS